MTATMICMRGVNAAVNSGPLFSTHHDMAKNPIPDPTIPCDEGEGSRKYLKDLE